MHTCSRARPFVWVHPSEWLRPRSCAHPGLQPSRRSRRASWTHRVSAHQFRDGRQPKSRTRRGPISVVFRDAVGRVVEVPEALKGHDGACCRAARKAVEMHQVARPEPSTSGALECAAHTRRSTVRRDVDGRA